MSVDMRDMADVLRASGVPVVEEGDWQHRGTGGSFDAASLMLHHDASAPGSTSGSADYIIDNLLSQLWLDFYGTWHVIAAGRMDHAGKGSWPGVPTDNANATFIGIETDHTVNEQWTSGQREYGLRGLIALADWLGIRGSAEDLYRHLIAHKEWAPTRKVDPDPLDMDDLRDVVLNGQGVIGMSVDVFTNNTPQEFHGDGKWKTVVLDDGGALSLLVGPAPAYVATAGLTLEPSGADPIEIGDVVQVRFGSVIDYEGDKTTQNETYYPVNEVPVTSGSTFGNLAWTNKLADADDGKLKLRLFINPPSGKTLTVSRVSARVTH